MLTFALLLGVLASVAFGQDVVRLEQYNVDKNTITVSGGSSGGYMASQMHVAFSRKFSGAGIIAGGPYYCSEGDPAKALLCGTTPGSIDTARLASLTLDFESRGDVDPTGNMANDKVWIFHGALDTIVDPGVGATIEEYYKRFGLLDENIYLDTSFPCQHSLPTEDVGGPCDELNHAQAYLNLCGYDSAYDVLQFFYGPLTKANSSTALLGQFLTFDQNEFIALPSGSSMDSSGIVYIPSGCVDKTALCRLHVVFHGCNQCKIIQEDKFTKGSGFCQTGELNNIIMLFPQTDRSVENPQACWDWWGYNDPIGMEGKFATKTGRQTEAVALMVDRIAGL